MPADHDPPEPSLGDGELGGVAADPYVLLPATPRGVWVTETGPFERPAGLRISVEPAQQVQIGFLDWV